MPVYNKLVRDKILEIIKTNGQRPTHKILTAEEYAVELTKKLVEEVEEYKKDKNTDELADIMEVVYALASLHGCTAEELEKIRAEKAEKRGGFEKKIFLVEVIDQGEYVRQSISILRKEFISFFLNQLLKSDPLDSESGGDFTFTKSVLEQIQSFLFSECAVV